MSSKTEALRILAKMQRLALIKERHRTLILDARDDHDDFTEALGDDDEYEPVEAVDHLEIDDYAYDMS